MDADVSADGSAHDELAWRQGLIERITACWSTQALRVAAELNLADLLHDEPLDAQTLAARCHCNSDALQRLLQALCTLDVCRERSDGCFELTQCGALLRRSPADGSTGLRAMALWWGGPMWSTWGDLGYSVRTGHSARALHTGRSHYGFMDSATALADLFHESMRAVTQLVAGDVARLKVWSSVRTVVDVGGGHGELATAVARAQPHLQVTILDRPDAEPGARKLLQARSLCGRVHFQPGDFFEEVPPAADCYMLKSILHNWSDSDCRRILHCCARAALPGARLLLVERIRPGLPQALPSDRALARTDLNMLIGLGGRERALEELTALLADSGFVVNDVAQMQHEFHAIECRVA